MTEYWKSQEKTFCDICKCWLTDNKSSVDFHKNGKRHKENVEKRLKEIHQKNKADEKRDKRFELDMQRIEKAALAACQQDSESSADITTTQKLLNSTGSGSSRSEAEDKVDTMGIGEPKILHRVEKRKPATSAPPIKEPSTSSGSIGAWKPVTAPTFVDLELPETNRVIYEPKQPQKRKIEFTQKTVASLESNASLSTSSWAKVEAPVAFKKRKSAKPNMRQRNDDD